VEFNTRDDKVPTLSLQSNESQTALLALVTSVSVAVKRSRLYMDNMHKMLVMLNDVATRASLHMSQVLMNRQRLSLHVLLGGA